MPILWRITLLPKSHLDIRYSLSSTSTFEAAVIIIITFLKGLVYDVALGRLQLPSTLGTLRLDIYLNQHYYDIELSRDFEPFTFLITRKVVYALPKRYPHLQRVHIGSKNGEWLWVKGRDRMWQARRERYHTLSAEMLSSEP